MGFGVKNTTLFMLAFDKTKYLMGALIAYTYTVKLKPAGLCETLSQKRNRNLESNGDIFCHTTGKPVILAVLCRQTWSLSDSSTCLHLYTFPWLDSSFLSSAE